MNKVGAALSCLAVLALSACSSVPSEGSGSPFQSGSTEASLEGSTDFSVSQVIRGSSGSIQGTLTYTGTCTLVKADLRFSYRKGSETLTGEQVDGIDSHFEIGPLAPNEPYPNSYLGEGTFTPDAVIFVISNERCV